MPVANWQPPACGQHNNADGVMVALKVRDSEARQSAPENYDVFTIAAIRIIANNTACS
jgi:hypothetical protein